MVLKQNTWVRYLFPFFLTLYIGFLMYMLSQFREAPKFEWRGVIWFGTMVYLIWEAGWLIGRRLDQKMPWQNGTAKRLMVQLLQTNAVGILIYLGTYIILNSYENFVLDSNNPLSIFHLMVATAMSLFVIQIINSVQIGYQLLDNWQQARLEAELSQKASAFNKLENIRHAFDRHFLLDHLKELETVIHQMPGEATEYLQRISETFSTNLDHLDMQLEGVQEELKITSLPANFRRERIEKPEFTDKKSRFLVRIGPKFMVVPTREVAGFYKDDSVLMFTKEGKKYVVDTPLEELMGKLPKQNFYRINRQCIINVDAVQEVRPEGTQLLLTLSVGLPKPLYVSQRNVAAFKKWLDDE